MSWAIPILFVLMAAFFKAASDTMAHHYATSIFKKWNATFWNAEISWKHAKYLRFTKYKLDGWHLSNTGMIICFCIAVVLHRSFLAWYWEFLFAGSIFNLTFNIFYNKILRRK